MEISFLLDENIPYTLLTFLLRENHRAFHVRKLGKAGIRNGEVYTLAGELKTWIVTRDKDFRNLSKFLTYDFPGVIFIEDSGQLRDTELKDIFSRFLENHLDKLSHKRMVLLD